ncbi:TerB family tellurite resistance protein [Thalassomonas sp. M1454]|uniref:tellurite resistance TerB family protein n=1 Tax=Thalassomonas sp. M1454 TaxID=2594477 RepID=UPI00117E0C28|nr:TerB family tellurite resistance protein [Thalassomonas sp. M1454]TRX54049.1 TerB family tellurite resistance protein [Thalassomonas sp. M1454]
MISRIRVFIKNLQQENVVGNVLSIEIATAVLLFEVMRADQENSETEISKVIELLQKQFKLNKNEVLEILAAAEDESFHANDFYRFTNTINNQFPLEERIKIVESLWLVAYADGVLDAIEEHIIRRIADLLHLRHSEYIQCKLKIQKQLNPKI